jgi:outer membrane protein
MARFFAPAPGARAPRQRVRLILPWLLRAAFGCFFLLALPGHGASADVSLGIGVNVNAAPYKHYGAQWKFLPLLSFENDYAYIREYAVGVKILSLEFFEFSAFGGYDGAGFTAGSSSDNSLRKLQNRRSSAGAGAAARLFSPYGMLHASVARDVLGRSHGWKGEIGCTQSLEYGPVEFIASVGAHWASGRYNSYYYGISDKESRASGLKAYAAGADFSPYIGLTITYGITDKWDVFCSGERVFLGDAVKGSPMVDGSGAHSVTTGVICNF